MARNGTTMSRKTTGVQSTDSTKIMPAMLCTSKGWDRMPSSSTSSWLIAPLRGPSRKIQPSTWMTVGKAKDVNAET